MNAQAHAEYTGSESRTEAIGHERMSRLIMKMLEADRYAKFLASSDGKILYCNAAATLIVGEYTPQYCTIDELIDSRIEAMDAGSNGICRRFLDTRHEPSPSPCEVFVGFEGVTDGSFEAHVRLEWIDDDSRRYIVVTVADPTFVDVDPLTGLWRRLHMNRKLADEIGSQRRLESEYMQSNPHGGACKRLALLFLDVDHFKSVNDTYGHHAGDVVLSEIARRIVVARNRSRDFVVRFGGEEFIIILPETSVDGGIEIAQRVLETISCEPIVVHRVLGGKPLELTITASIGLAVIEHGETAKELIAAANSAMRKAKEGGRNRVVYRKPL